MAAASSEKVARRCPRSDRSAADGPHPAVADGEFVAQAFTYVTRRGNRDDGTDVAVIAASTRRVRPAEDRRTTVRLRPDGD